MDSSHPIIAFCHLRKTGGLAFNSLLRRRFGAAHLDTIVRYLPGTRTNQPFYTREHLRQDLLIYPRLRSISGHYLSPSVDYGDIGRRFQWIVFLRDPCQRFVSHYAHHVEKMGSQVDFVDWMENPQYHNDQVKTLAGEADLEKAKSILSRMIVGLTERHDLSLLVIRELLPRFRFDTSYRPIVNAARKVVDTRHLLEKHESRIREVNSLGMQLYEYAVNEIWPRQLAGLDLPRLEDELAKGNDSRGMTLIERIRLGACRAKRNLVYKPYVWMRQPR